MLKGMDLQMAVWPRINRASIAAMPLFENAMTRVRPWLSWQALGAALLGVMIARWTWLLFAPAGAAMPPVAWEPSSDGGRLFGTAPESAAAATLTTGDIKLVGVFANRTKGFAVMQIDDRQVGVALGHEVRPGVRLVETHSDYVVLDQGGVRERVVLSGASPRAGPNGSALPKAAPPGPAPQTSRQTEALQHQLDAAGSAIPPQKREALQQQIERLKGGH